MLDMTSIGAAFSAIKATKEIIQGVLEAKVDVDAKAKIIDALTKVGEIQDNLFMLREELSSLQDRNSRLSGENEKLNQWNAKTDNYELTETEGGAVVYRFKGTPSHYICPSCYNKAEIQILQDNRTMSGKYRCTACKAEFPIKVFNKSSMVAVGSKSER